MLELVSQMFNEMHFCVMQDERRELDLLRGVSLDVTEDTMCMKDIMKVNGEQERTGDAAELYHQHQGQEEVHDFGTPV